MKAKILAISGSLRSGSTNTAFLLAAKTLATDLADIAILDDLEKLPFFNPDLPLPSVVARLQQRAQEVDALLISTPEYAHGIPGVLKNMLDWLVSYPEIVGKKVGLIYASTGEASFAQASLREILTTMSMQIVPGAILNVMTPRTKIDHAGVITDPKLKDAIFALVKSLVDTPTLHNTYSSI